MAKKTTLKIQKQAGAARPYVIKEGKYRRNFQTLKEARDYVDTYEARMHPKMIRNLQDLIDHFGATDALNLNRRIYKDTGCGASISVRRPNHTGKAWLHNGQSREEWDALIEIDAFTIQTIVEGSDATVDSDTFVLPVKISDVDKWIEDMEAEASRLWKEANENEEDDDDIQGDELAGVKEPYAGPLTFTIDAPLALRLFTDWHQDDEVSRAQARDYANRLLTRLFQEAKGK